MGFRQAPVAFLFAVIILTASGCSGGSSPLDPHAGPGTSANVVSPPPDLIVYGRSILMAYDVTCDFTTGEIDLVPLRTMAKHFDVRPLLTSPWFCPAKNCIKILFLETDPVNGYFKLKATLVNPSNLTAYDVRGIVYDNAESNHRMLNADDYTKLWAPTGYDSVYPFRAFAKSDPERAIHPLAAFSEIYEFQFDSFPPKWNFFYAVDCSWPTSCEEPYEISEQTQIGDFYTTHGCTKLSVKVKHHAGPAHVSGVTLDTTSLSGGLTEMTYNLDEDLWETTIIDETLSLEPGPRDLLLTASATGTELCLYDYFRIDVKSSDEVQKISGTVWDESTGLGIPLARMTTSDGENLYTADADYCGFFTSGDVPEGSRVLSLTGPGYHTVHALTVVESENIVLERNLPVNPGDQPEMPVIEMNEPIVDLVTGIAIISGMIHNLDCLDLQRGIYVHQSEEHLMAVDEVDDTFEQAVILTYGVNEIVVRATNATGTVLSDKITVEYYPEWNFRITLTWDTDETDIDLHIWEPDLNEHCYWYNDWSAHLQLDYDDVQGYGPENITPISDDVPEGIYPVAVDYYSGDDAGYAIDTSCFVTLRLNVGTPSEEIVQFSHMLTEVDYNDNYPVQYDTDSWWRVCDMIMQPSGIITWQPPDYNYVLWE